MGVRFEHFSRIPCLKYLNSNLKVLTQYATIPYCTLTSPKLEPEGYWDDLEHCRAFLTAYAEKMGFDPNVHKNWRQVSLPHFRANGVKSFLPLPRRDFSPHFQTGRPVVE